MCVYMLPPPFLLLLFCSAATALRVPCLSRRELLLGAGVGLPLAAPPSAAAKMPLSTDEQDRLDALSKFSRDTLPSTTLPSGVVVLDLYRGSGPEPRAGDLVYAHFKVWPRNFRSGTPADSSFLDTRPHEWRLGTPDERIRAGFDEGIVGMREDGWRRLIVPASLAYGSAGLTTQRGVALVEPDEPVFVDVILVDGGSGRCAEILRPAGVSEVGARRLKSISCVRGAP